MFVDIYDVRPLQGPPTHDRVGNRRPFGWVRRRPAALEHPAGGSGRRGELQFRTPARAGRSRPAAPRPGIAARHRLDSRRRAGRRAAQGHAWEEVDRRVWVRPSDLPPDRWGVWLSRDELLVFLCRILAPSATEHREITRLRRAGPVHGGSSPWQLAGLSRRGPRGTPRAGLRRTTDRSGGERLPGPRQRALDARGVVVGDFLSERPLELPALSGGRQGNISRTAIRAASRPSSTSGTSTSGPNSARPR